MPNVGKLEAQVQEALDRTENRSTRESGIRTLQDIISQRSSEEYLIILKLVFSPRNRNIWKVLLEPIITGMSSTSTSITVILLKYVFNCITEETCHAKCTELIEKLYRESRDEFVLDHIFERIPYSRSPGIAMCLLNIARTVVELEMHVEIFSQHLFKLHANTRYQFLYNEWILCLSEIMIQRSYDFLEKHTDTLARISIECAKILIGELRHIRLNRDVAMAGCVFLSVVPRVLPESSLGSISTSVIRSLSRTNLHLFALTRCFPKLRSTIAAAHAAWMPFTSPTSPERPLTRTTRITADSVRSRVIESVTNLSSPERIPPQPMKEPLLDQSESLHEISFVLNSSKGETTTRWDLYEEERNDPETSAHPTEPPVFNRPSFNSEFVSLISSGTEDDLVEFLFVHEPVWAALIDDENVVLLFHLLVELVMESQDCPSVLDRLYDYLDACDERVAKLVHKKDIVALRDTLSQSLDNTLLTPSLRSRTRKILQYMFGQ